jgi:predicted amidohydrolase YtcJ
MDLNYLLYNGFIHTLYPRRPVVSAIAISGDRIVGIGNDDLCHQFSKIGEKIDLGKNTVIPGLTDAHAHLNLYTDFLNNVDLFGTGNAEEVVSRVLAYNEKVPGTSWITGWGWGQEDWPGRAFPTAALIDRLIFNRPVFLTGKSGHVAWINSLALHIANISQDTNDPPGGEIQRDALGQPTGILFDEAIKLIERVVPKLTVDVLASRMRDAILSINQQGITGLHDNDGADCFQALQILRGKNDLTLRVIKNLPLPLLTHAIELGLRWGFGDDFLRIGGIKIFADGALGSRTAAMFAPYEGEPENIGIIVTEKEDIIEAVHKASLAGLPSAIHAIGDRAVHDVLDAYETVRKIERSKHITPSSRRHRIEHVQLIHPKDIHRLAELNVIASMQPIHATSDMMMADQCWGDRAAYSYNWRLQLKYGTILAFGSDAPVESINPFWGIHAAVTRRRLDGSPNPAGWRSDNNGCLSVDEAIQAYTAGPSVAAGQENKLGKLMPGYLADLVVLNQDIYTIDPMAIADTKPLSVMIGGEWVVGDHCKNNRNV